MLPAAIPSDVASEPAVVMLTTNAPAKIAGHPRYPSVSSVASAIPVGGQTADALEWTEASERPTLPARA